MKLFLFVTILASSMNTFGLINGKKQKNNFPSVQLYFKNGSHICSGTFIDPYTILTAAHCIKKPDKTWENYSLSLEKIFDKKGNEIPFVHVRHIPHPKYTYSFPKSTHDLGIIKIKENNYFQRYPDIGNSLDESVTLYGCGKIDLKTKKRKCLMGGNDAFSFLGYLAMWGESSDTDKKGHNVSIAPNDSGGAVVNTSTKKIIGVHWGTWISITSSLSVPNLNFSTSLLDKENFNFVKSNLGELTPKPM